MDTNTGTHRDEWITALRRMADYLEQGKDESAKYALLNLVWVVRDIQVEIVGRVLEV